MLCIIFPLKVSFFSELLHFSSRYSLTIHLFVLLNFYKTKLLGAYTISIIPYQCNIKLDIFIQVSV